MSSMQQVLAAAPPVSVKGPRRPPGHRHLHGSDFRWAIAFSGPCRCAGMGIHRAAGPIAAETLSFDKFWAPDPRRGAQRRTLPFVPLVRSRQ
jgi:hypothetical protein